MTQTPSVGRIVHYHTGDNRYPDHVSQDIAGIITEVHPSFSDDIWYAMSQGNDGEIVDQSMVVRLKILWPDGDGHLPEWGTLAPYSEAPKPGHWNWPPRT